MGPPRDGVAAKTVAIAPSTPVIRARFAAAMKNDIDRHKPVRVFKNWTRGCYSIMQDGALKASASQVRLSDVEFLVRTSGRERMLRGARRNVHAYAAGLLVDFVHPSDSRRLERVNGRRVDYDPFKASSFLDEDSEERVGAASAAHFDEDGVTYEAA